MVKIVRIEFGKSFIEIEDDKEILWNSINKDGFDWNVPLFIKDSTNPMNDIVINMKKFTVIKRYEK